MTIEQLRTVHHSSPFRPFSIRLADGRSFPVQRPEFLSRSPSGRTIIVQYDDDRYSVLDLSLITNFEVHSNPKQPGEAAA